MLVQLDMPASQLILEDLSDERGLKRLRQALTFSVKQFKGWGKPDIIRTCLIGEDGSFRTGLWPRIKSIAPAMGFSIGMEQELRVRPESSLVFPRAVSLRDYQERAVTALLPHSMGTLCGATGSGKTRMAAAIIQRRGVPTIFFVHTKDLLWQAHASFEETLGVKVGVIGDSEADVRDVTVATIQTMNRLDEVDDRWEQVIVDECHHLAASTFFNVTGKFSSYYAVALTATPYRVDGADLMIEAGGGPIVARITVTDLVAAGMLTRVLARFIPMAGGVSYAPMPRHAVVEKWIVRNATRNQVLADAAKEHAQEGKSVLVAVNQIAHANLLAGLIGECETLIGSKVSRDRKAILQRLQNKTMKIVIATLGKEGLDVPALDVVINGAGGTDSTQLVGRVMRISPGKKNALYIDVIDSGHITLQKASYARLKRMQAEPAFTVVVG